MKKTIVLAAVLTLAAATPAAPLAAEEANAGPASAEVEGDSQAATDAAKKPQATAEPAKKPASEAAKKPAAPKKPRKPAGPNSRARIFVNGAFTSGSIDYAQTRTFREFAEDGRIDTDYSVDSGLGFELGFHYKFKPEIGVMASVTTASRDSVLTYSADLPHPLFLDRDRQVTGTEEGLSYSETAVHLDFVYTIQTGSLDVMFFAGPSYVDVSTDVLARLNYTEAYPYDEVTVTSVSLEEKGDNGFGFNVGAGLDYRFGKTKKFGIGAQLRYTTASITLAPTDGPTVDVDSGGLQAAVGVRLYF